VRLAVAILALCAVELTAACVPPALEANDRKRKDGGSDDSGSGRDSARPRGGTSGAPVATGGTGAGGTGGTGGSAAASGGAGGTTVPVSGGGAGGGGGGRIAAGGGTHAGGSTGGSGTGGSSTGGSAAGGTGGVVGGAGGDGTGGDDGTGGEGSCDMLVCVAGGGVCCDFECVDTSRAPLHCGDCTTQCTHDEVCLNSQCIKLSCGIPALLDASAPDTGSLCAPGEACCDARCCAPDERCCDFGQGNLLCEPGAECLPP
jgi:hypothetical protein